MRAFLRLLTYGKWSELGDYVLELLLHSDTGMTSKSLFTDTLLLFHCSTSPFSFPGTERRTGVFLVNLPAFPLLFSPSQIRP